MLTARDPGEAYRRVDFDARVSGASAHQLVDLCFEQFGGSIDRAIFAAGRNDNAMKSAALTRAVAALIALQMGVDGSAPAGTALLQLYDSARKAVLDCAVRFDADKLRRIQADFAEIREALRGAAAAG